MQTSAMKACFQIAECSFSFAKISNIPVTSKYLASYFILFSIKTSIWRVMVMICQLNIHQARMKILYFLNSWLLKYQVLDSGGDCFSAISILSVSRR